MVVVCESDAPDRQEVKKAKKTHAYMPIAVRKIEMKKEVHRSAGGAGLKKHYTIKVALL